MIRRGVFWKKGEHGVALLMLYVDDFKMASHCRDTANLWAPLRKRIRMADPKAADRFLGCYAKRFSAPISTFKSLMETLPSQWSRLDDDGEKRKTAAPWRPKDPNRIVHGYEYEMCHYNHSLVDRYCSIAGIERSSLKPAYVPFLDEAKDPSGVEESPDAPSGGQTLAGVVTKIDNIVAAAKKKAAPKPGSGFAGTEGELNRNAASVGMAALYGARLARHDLLRAIQRLAERLHKWTPLDSKKLHRLFEYINTSADHVQYAFSGDDWKDITLAYFTDADWASDKSDFHSTSGGFFVLLGPHTFFPIAAKCAKQTAVSLSTPEAEIYALLIGLKELGVPALDLWEVIFEDTVVIEVFEDNEATIRVVNSGKWDKAFGHASRTHSINLSWLNHVKAKNLFRITNCHTHAMCADIFTKYFVDPIRWQHAITLISVRPCAKVKYVDHSTQSGSQIKVVSSCSPTALACAMRVASHVGGAYFRPTLRPTLQVSGVLTSDGEVNVGGTKPMGMRQENPYSKACLTNAW